MLSQLAAVVKDAVTVCVPAAERFTKDKYKEFTQEIEKLCDFLKIFKKNLEKIAIDKKVDKDDFKIKAHRAEKENQP